jgi:hypothetical protein
MKKILLPLVLFCVLPAILRAQIRRMTFRYDSTSIIQDTAGHILPAQEWHRLMTRGDYVINHDKDSAGRMYGTLKQLTRAERVHLAIRVEPEESTAFTTGETLPFNLHGLDGRLYSLPAKGKIVVLHFGCFACEGSDMQLPPYNELVDSFGTNPDMLFLAIGTDDPATAKKALDTIPFRYHAIAGQSHLYQSWGIRIIPQDVIVDKEGKVYYHVQGLGNTTMVWLGRKIGEIAESRNYLKSQ